MKTPILITCFAAILACYSCSSVYPENNIRRVTGIVVDGVADDWQGKGTAFPLIADLYGRIDTMDFQCDLKLGWNAEGLYFFAEIRDDTLQGKKRGNRSGDQLEIFVSERSCTNEMVQYLVADLTHSGKKLKVNKFDYRKGVPVQGVKEMILERSMVSGSLRLEGFIPSAYLGFDLVEGKELGINVKYVDADRSERNAYTLYLNNNTYVNHCNVMPLRLSVDSVENLNTIITKAWTLDREMVNIKTVNYRTAAQHHLTVSDAGEILIRLEIKEYGRYNIGEASFRRGMLTSDRTAFHLESGREILNTIRFRDTPLQFERIEPYNGFEYDIARFEEMDLIDPPSDSSVMFLGSSSIRLWKSLESDFPGLQLLNRGFGGSRTTDMLHYFDRLFSRARPSVIVYFCGNNDLTRGSTPAEVAENVALFLEKVEEEMPGTKVIVLSVKASISQIRTLPEVHKTNILLEDLAASLPNATYVDVIQTMLDDTGAPVREIFSPDLNHMNQSGYFRWTGVVKPVLDSLLRQ